MGHFWFFLKSVRILIFRKIKLIKKDIDCNRFQMNILSSWDINPATIHWRTMLHILYVGPIIRFLSESVKMILALFNSYTVGSCTIGSSYEYTFKTSFCSVFFPSFKGVGVANRNHKAIHRAYDIGIFLKIIFINIFWRVWIDCALFGQ